MYNSIICERCGKAFMSSLSHGLCMGCASRKANGKRLALENREEKAFLAEENRRYARQAYADIMGVPLSRVPHNVDDDFLL